MRTLATTLCLLAGLGTLVGCGGDETEGLDVGRTAAATAEKGTARIALSVSVSGAGLPLPLELKGRGVTALAKPAGELTFDLGPILGLAGVPSSTPGDLGVRYTGGTLFVKPPRIDQLRVPGGKPWVKLDVPALATAAGLPTRGLGKLFTIEPAAQLRALEAAKGLEEIGKEDVGGAETTHYRGTIRLTDVVATLPKADRDDVNAGIAELEKLAPGTSDGFSDPVPAELWVDEDGITRRLSSTVTIPAQRGVPAGTVRQTYELSEFGTELDASAPPVEDTFDATATISGLLDGLARGGGGA